MGRRLPGSQIIDEGPRARLIVTFRVRVTARAEALPLLPGPIRRTGQRKVVARALAPDCARAAERRRRVQDTYLCTY